MYFILRVCPPAAAAVSARKEAPLAIIIGIRLHGRYVPIAFLKCIVCNSLKHQ